MNTFNLTNRPRRLRQNASFRDLVRETTLHPNDFIYPLFIKEGLSEKVEVSSMPGVYQYSLKDLKSVAKELENLNLKAVILFAVPNDKDELGSSSLQKDGLIPKAIHEIKSASNLLVITDLCFCEYTSHGHCGALDDKHYLDNDQTLELLAKQALVHAEASSDVIAPSGMIDGMVKAIRMGLDEQGYQNTPILSYAAKYQSALYGPFREAAEGTPQFGDRSTYQMDIANRYEALKEVALDVNEGADMLMVKPALFYLDIIRDVKNAHPEVPLCSYFVSGEYSMLVNAYQNGIVNKERAILESHTSIKRAGSDLIITYFAKEILKLL